MRFFPIGQTKNENLTVRMGNCPPRRCAPELIKIVADGVVRPEQVITRTEQPVLGEGLRKTQT